MNRATSAVSAPRSSPQRTASTNWPRTVAILAALSIIQVAAFDQVWIADRVRIDLMLLVVVSIGLRAEVRQATVLGFVIGLFVDVFRFGPFGMHALIFCLAGWALSNNGTRMLQVGAVFRLVQGVVAVLLVIAATWTTAAVFGQRPPEFGNESLISVALTAIVGGMLLRPIDWITNQMVDDAGPSKRVSRTDMIRAES